MSAATGKPATPSMRPSLLSTRAKSALSADFTDVQPEVKCGLRLRFKSTISVKQ
jgi:hypothetical protein